MQTTRLFRLLFWAALVFAFVMAALPEPPALLPGNPGDKVQHIAAFLVLGALAALGYPGLGLLLIFLGLAVFGAAIEVVQAIPQLGRTPSWLDWFADLAAIAIALMIAGVLRHWRQRQGGGAGV